MPVRTITLIELNREYPAGNGIRAPEGRNPGFWLTSKCPGPAASLANGHPGQDRRICAAAISHPKGVKADFQTGVRKGMYGDRVIATQRQSPLTTAAS